PPASASGGGRSRLVADARERLGVADRQVGEHLAVDLDPGGPEPVDELRVRHAVTARRCVDADDPEAAEVALAVTPVAVGVAARALDLLLGQPVARVLAPPVAPGLREDLLAPPPAGDGVRGPAHLPALPRQEPAHALSVRPRDLGRQRHAALPLRRLLLEDVAGEGAPPAQLPRRGLAEALLRARVGLHLRHRAAIEADGPSPAAPHAGRDQAAGARSSSRFGAFAPSRTGARIMCMLRPSCSGCGSIVASSATSW